MCDTGSGNTQQPISARSDETNGLVQNPSNPYSYRAGAAQTVQRPFSRLQRCGRLRPVGLACGPDDGNRRAVRGSSGSISSQSSSSNGAGDITDVQFLFALVVRMVAG